MSDEPTALSYEQSQWLMVSREIEDMLLRGFRGSLFISCPGDGTVEYYDINYDQPKKGEMQRGERRVLKERRVIPRPGSAQAERDRRHFQGRRQPPRPD